MRRASPAAASALMKLMTCHRSDSVRRVAKPGMAWPGSPWVISQKSSPARRRDVGAMRFDDGLAGAVSDPAGPWQAAQC